jgi:hypothetical protein
MGNARRNLFIAIVLGLTAISTIATALPASAASGRPTTIVSPLNGISRG